MSETSAPLKLIALDGDDLAVISAHVQDGVVRPADIVAEKGRLVVPVNRFAWESPASRRRFFPRHERRNSVLDIACVRTMKAKGINREDVDSVLSVLAVTFQPADTGVGNGGGTENGGALDRLSITFAGDATLALEVDGLDVRLTDLGGSWATRSKPVHRDG